MRRGYDADVVLLDHTFPRRAPDPSVQRSGSRDNEYG